MKDYRKIRDLEYSIERYRKDYNKNTILYLICLFFAIIFTILEYLVVYELGTMFDIVATSIIIGFLSSMSFILIRKSRHTKKKLKTIKRELFLENETDEERIRREREEKLTRVLKKK